MTMKVSRTLVLKIVIGLVIAFIIAGISGYLSVLRKDKAEEAPKEAEKAKDMAAEVKISAEARPAESLISSVFIDNDLVLEVLPAIAKQAGISIVPDERVVGLVTCELKDVPLDRALEIVLTGTPYTVKKMPDYYLICPGDTKATKIPLE
jgi:type II secretory pathway component HofQ